MSLFYGLDTEAYDRAYSDQELIGRILSYFAPHRRRVLLVGILITAIALLLFGGIGPGIFSFSGAGLEMLN